MLGFANTFSMTGRNVLFASWPVSVSELRPHIPPALEIDTYDGQAWVSALTIYVEQVRSSIIDIDAGIQFPQLNFRTYVSYKGKPGVYFLTLDTGEDLGAILGRPTLGLPFFRSSIKMETNEEGVVDFKSRRTQPGVASASFEVQYVPNGKQHTAESGSLEEFLIERHAYFVLDEGGPRAILSKISGNNNRSGVKMGQIEREPWTLCEVSAEIRKNTLFRALGLSDPKSTPHLRFSPLFTTTSRPLETVNSTK